MIMELIQRTTVNTIFYVDYDENGIKAVKKVHKNDAGYYYNKRESRQYVNVQVSNEHVYRLGRYYRCSKAFSSLKMMVVSLSSILPEYVYPY